MQLEITDSDAWYVRGALHRAITAIQQQNDDCKEGLLEHPDLPGTVRASVKNMVAYNEQWLREAQEAFARLPVDLRP